MLNRENVVLVFIDVQGRLHEIMYEKEDLDRNLERMVRCAALLDIPAAVTEQIPEKLGATNEPFRSLLFEAEVIAKTSFSCCGEPAFMSWLRQQKRRQVLLVGIEAHVCVYQTAIDLIEGGYEVFVAADGVSSRAAENKSLALEAMRDAGAVILPVESLFFALLRDAADSRFKELLRLIK
ncbi:MAG: isochorismatase family protein [Pontiellaceae bacterium]|nr:isochorismatase family protein [Pontiellaceae bacterium]MBN2786638.1 isochorismatase family protein [Pontiellaceae bacterium]